MPRWRIFYDDQCEICQASMAWLRMLDPGGVVVALPITGAEGPAPEAALLRELHAVSDDGRVLRGAEALAALAREFRLTWLLGWVASLPGLHTAAARMYRWVARHRYGLSRCRGGQCRVQRTDLLKQPSQWQAFQLCRFTGWCMITPLGTVLWARRMWLQFRTWLAVRGKVARLLDGRLTLFFLGGGVSATVPIFFGELFAMIRYGSLLVDPGGTRMGRSVARHLRSPAGQGIRHVAPSHAHEEHCGNLDLVVNQTGALLYAHTRAIPLLLTPPRIPFMRRLVIGQPQPITSAIEPLPAKLALDGGLEVWILETPGHCVEHASFYAPRDRLLLIGDGFMGTHFSSPNDDVNHMVWMRSLERLLELDIEIMVEGHGHVHTLREDVLKALREQGLSVMASRHDPKHLLQQKLDFLKWVSEQIAVGEQEGLPGSVIQATVFPWTQRWSYESAGQDRLAASLSGGEFGRHKVLRSFRCPSGEGNPYLPMVYEMRITGPAGDSEASRPDVRRLDTPPVAPQPRDPGPVPPRG